MTRSKIRTSGAEGLTLSSTALTIANGLTLTDGNIALASGHGLTFAATSDAGGMASELLDDYEEGTYTPAKNNGGSVSYSFQGGYYIKVGRLCHVYMDITISSASSETGSANITLPFTSQSGTNYCAFCPWIVDTGYTSSTRQAAGFVNGSNNYMYMYRYNTENNSGYAYCNNNTTGRWSGNFTYYTA